MGVAMTQHPELFGAIWCGYPLLDMIRFQNFLVGRWWTAEYGSAENARSVPLPAEIFSVPECEGWDEVSGDHVQHRRFAIRASPRCTRAR